VYRAAVLSGMVEFAVAMSVAIPAYLAFAQAGASQAVDAMLASNGWRTATNQSGATVPGAQLQWVSQFFGPLTFVIATPIGLVSAYLVLTSFIRIISAWVDDPLGDPLLTFADWLLFRSKTKRDMRQKKELRESLEGAEVADRVVSGAKAGIPEAELVVITSRRKPEWVKGAFIITSDKWYRLAEPVHRDTPNGLRTLYPMSEVRDLEVMRNGIPYEFPGELPSETNDHRR
jgi:hypothetical protein